MKLIILNNNLYIGLFTILNDDVRPKILTLIFLENASVILYDENPTQNLFISNNSVGIFQNQLLRKPHM